MRLFQGKKTKLKPYLNNMAAITVVEKSGLQETSNGAFVRSASAHRSIIGTDPAFPPESGRYLLVASLACPWAHRCVIARSLLGLENAVPLCVVHPTWAETKPDVDGHRGWVFVSPESDPIMHPSGVNTVSTQGCILPPSEFAQEWKSVRSIYDASGAGDAKKFTVPILFDMKRKLLKYSILFINCSISKSTDKYCSFLKLQSIGTSIVDIILESLIDSISPTHSPDKISVIFI